MTKSPRRPERPRRAAAASASRASDAAAAAVRSITAHGSRSTRARVDVLATLLVAHEALSHHDVEERLGPGRRIDRVTLYRVLDWLVAQGLAHKLAGEDRVWRFSASAPRAGGGAPAGGPAHAHFHCVGCGKIVCLDEARMPVIPVPSGYRRHDVDVTVKGYCDRCSR